MSRRTRNIVIAVMLLLVIVPLIPLVLWSFTDTWPFGNPLPNFSLRAWIQNLQNSQVITALCNSLMLCVTVVPLSLVLSFYAAKNLGTRRFKGRRAIQLLLLVPSFIPQISIVFGIQKVFSRIGLYNNVQAVYVMLLIFYVPYMTLLLSTVFENYDLDYERQAACLGVGKLQTLFRITIPQIRSGLIVTCIFSFIGVWSAYLSVSAVAPPTFKTMSLLAFPMMNSASNGYAATAGVTILYIVPILIVLLFFSRVLVNDKNEIQTGI